MPLGVANYDQNIVAGSSVCITSLCTICLTINPISSHLAEVMCALKGDWFVEDFLAADTHKNFF